MFIKRGDNLPVTSIVDDEALDDNETKDLLEESKKSANKKELDLNNKVSESN